MADITIVKLKVRRGSDAQRKTIVLDQGEVGYTLDTQRLFVGDGSTYGGRVIGSRSVGPFASVASLGPIQTPGLQRGDIGYADSKLYMLTATNHVYTDDLSGFAYIGNVPDESLIEFDGSNNLTVKKNPGALNAAYFSESFFGGGLLSSGDVMTPDLNADYLELSGWEDNPPKISPKQGSITQREIASTAFGTAGGPIVGGGGDTITLNVNESQFQIAADGSLEFHNLGSLNTGAPVIIDTTQWAGDVPGKNLAGGGVTTNGVNPGLFLNTGGQLETRVKDVDTGAFVGLDDAGRVTLQGAASAAQEFPFLDTRGGLIINEIQSSVWDVVTAYGLSGQANDGIPIGSILPHARAFTTIPGGYLLCDGKSYEGSDPTYGALYKVIGQQYGAGSGASESFNVPNLSANQVLYGYGADASDSSPSYYLSAADSPVFGTAYSPSVSATAVNYIIKYDDAPILNIFNGCPNQVTQQFLGSPGTGLRQQVYECMDSSSNRVELSSAGFITFALSGLVRNADSPAQNGFSNSTFDKFAIPVFNY
tara:strand:+ start:905 stop:2515 length:1611 start_codon:yes stop_codon:yes gene_type:complete